MFKKFFASFIVALMMTIPFIAADAYALNFATYDNGKPIVEVYDSKNKANGYVESGETLVMRVVVEDADTVTSDQIRFSDNLYFNKCVATSESGVYECTYTEDAYSISRDQKFNLYLMDKQNSGVYDVPSACLPELCSDNKNCEDCAPYVELKPDTIAPKNIDIDFVALDEGGFGIEYYAEDSGSGIKKIAVFANGNPAPVYEEILDLDTDTMSYPKIAQGVTGGLGLSEGFYDLLVTFYDGLGNERSKSKNDLHIDTTAPELRDYHFLLGSCVNGETLDNIKENSVEAFGSSRREVCIALELAPGEDDIEFANGTLINYDTSNLGSTNIVSKYCTDEYCYFDYFDTDGDGFGDEKIYLDIDKPGYNTIIGNFRVVDGYGNIGEKALSNTIQLYDQGPVIIRLSSENEDDGTYYVGNDGRFVFEFDSPYPVQEAYVKIDCGNLRADCGSIPADDCNSNRCTWTLSNLRSSDLPTTVYVVAPVDQFGNVFTGNVENSIITVTSDISVPRLKSVKVGKADDDYRLETSKDQNLSICILDDGNTAGGCTIDSFWADTFNPVYFEDGDYMDVDITFTDNVKPKLAYIIASDITNSDIKWTGDCEVSGNNELSCSWDGIGQIDRANAKGRFVLVLEDVAGNTIEYKVPVDVFSSSTSEQNFWDVNNYYLSPSVMDKSLISIYPASQLVYVNLDDIGGGEIVYVKANCRDSDNYGYIDDVTPYWDGSSVYLDLVYNQAEINEDSAEIICDLEIKTVDNNFVYGPEEETFTFDVDFINAPFGDVDESIQAKINEVAKPWNESIGMRRLTNELSGFMNVMHNICGISAGIGTGIAVIAGIVDGLKNPFTQGASSVLASGPLATIQGLYETTILPFETSICGAITCQFCDSALNPPTSTPDENGRTTTIDPWLVDKAGAVDADPWSAMDSGFWEGNDASLEKCFATIGWGSDWGDEFDTLDLCRVVGPLICLTSQNQYAQALNNPLSNDLFGGIGSYASDVLPPEAQPQSNGPYDSLILSTLTLCLPGIMHNLEKQRQIDCAYIRCLTEDVPDGTSTVAMCDSNRAYASCTFVRGEIWNFIPFAGFFDQVQSLITDFFLDPINMLQYTPGLVCAIICAAPGTVGACTGCESIIGLINSVSTIVNIGFDVAGLFGEDGEFSMDKLAEFIGWDSGSGNACVGIFDELGEEE